ISCQLPNGHIETIHRNQIEVLPNFAMTDYSSQGRTRPFNVIDLTDCHTHLSYYTCFSRSATVAGTVIMLDEITRLRSDGTLHPSVEGELRTSLMVNYRKWRG
ncbi:hypothetical protein M422DRAFT_78177, partial [Sphaerobolus stellatus SS14]